ncbi:unnamed protein product [Withania somnifera]
MSTVVKDVHSNGNVHSQNGPNSKPFKIFVGYDPREDVAYELREKGLYWRERGKLESTEFPFPRFLTPHLVNFEGWAMFVDCGFLYLGDIKELRDMVDDKYALICVRHNYAPKETTKMDGAVQTVYPRKNWFMWLEDGEIGEVPFVWNFLVGHNKIIEVDPTTYPKSTHYTLGGPWFEANKDCEFGDLWIKELEEYKKATEKSPYGKQERACLILLDVSSEKSFFCRTC